MNGPMALFFDVETTGLKADDRIVSLGAILVDLSQMRLGEFDIKYCHLIFDPGKRSHPAAEEAHGYDDWLLRHQRYFHEELASVSGLFTAAEMVVGHNLRFDLEFARRQLGECGYVIGNKDFRCTMMEYRDQFERGKSGLQFAARRFGLKRKSKVHSALEDAWLAMGVFAGLYGYPFPRTTPEGLLTAPGNLISPPPRPGVKLPPRRPFSTSLPPLYREMMTAVERELSE